MKTTLRPVRWDLELYQGDTFYFECTLAEGGNPIDLSAATIVARVKSKLAGEDVLTSFEVVQQSAAGELSLKLTGEQTALLTAGTWDCKIDYASNERTFFQGKVSAERNKA